MVALALAALLSACTEYDAARRDHARGHHAQALARAKPLAQAGHVEAQYLVAQMYFQGQGTPEDPTEGARWLLLAASSGSTAAMVQLGQIFEDGANGVVDAAQAAQWFHRAARLGDAVARFKLGMMYWNGAGVPRDRAAALAWLHLAADAGSVAGRLRAAELSALASPAELLRVPDLVARFSDNGL